MVAEAVSCREHAAKNQPPGCAPLANIADLLGILLEAIVLQAIDPLAKDDPHSLWRQLRPRMDIIEKRMHNVLSEISTKLQSGRCWQERTEGLANFSSLWSKCDEVQNELRSHDVWRPALRLD